MNELVIAQGECSASFASIGAEPGLLPEDRARLSPDAEVLALRVAVQAFLPTGILSLSFNELLRNWHGGVIVHREECSELFEKSVIGIAVCVVPASGDE